MESKMRNVLAAVIAATVMMRAETQAIVEDEVSVDIPTRRMARWPSVHH
jgi:hypothetical protein